MKRVLFITLAAIGLAACSTSQPAASGVTYQTYAYTCCDNGETMQLWHAGERRTIKWTAVPAATTSTATAVPVVIRTQMTGPFATVADLKNATANSTPNTAARTVDGTPLQINNRTADGVVSVIQLPSDLPIGLYNLELDTDFGGGNRQGSSTIIVVN